MIAIFVYGTLMPGRLRWPIIEPHVVGRREATISGSLLDTGRGYPGVRLDGLHLVHGWRLVLAPNAASAAIRRLDQVEGPDYRRVVVPTSAGPAEAYEWLRDDPSERLLPEGRWDADLER